MNKAVPAPSANGNDDGAARAVIDAAGTMLRTDRGGMPAGFVQLLFGRTAPEDLAGVGPAEIALLAREAWGFFASRKPGAAKVRVGTPAPETGPYLKTISIVEIVNDDMPFLVDSVMGELAERGLDLHLVAHPIVTVGRDGEGKLADIATQLGGKEHGKAGSVRESYIHLHIDRIDDGEKRIELARAIEGVLADVRLCVQDWKPMLARVSAVIADLKQNPPPIPVDDIAVSSPLGLYQ